MASPNWKKEPRASWRALRELAGLTCEDVAQRLNVDRTTVQRWELGQRNPDSPRKYRTVLEEMEDEALFGLELIILAAGLVTESRAMDLSPTDYIDHIETNGGIPALALRLSTKEVPAMWQGPT